MLKPVRFCKANKMNHLVASTNCKDEFTLYNLDPHHGRCIPITKSILNFHPKCASKVNNERNTIDSYFRTKQVTPAR